MRTKGRTRFLSVVLCLLMILSLLPASAFAADTTSTWEPVDLADVTASDVVAITMTKDGNTWVLPAANTGSSPAASVGTVSDGKLTASGSEAAFGWKIAASGSGYTIQNTSGEYLYVDATLTANEKTKNAAVRIGSTAAVWTLSTENYLTTPDPVTEGTTRYLGVYNGNDWRDYTSINNNIRNQTLQFWKFKGEAEPDPTPVVTPEPTEEPADQTLLTKLDGAPADGDTVYLYYPADQQVLTATASGKKLAGEKAALNEDQIVLTDAMAALKVSVAENVYTFALADGKVLTSAETGNGLSFADPAENDLAKWTLEQQADGTWYLMNVGAVYSDQHNQALEYYNGFTTYGVKADNPQYKFEFYAEVNADPVSGLKSGDVVAIYNDANAKALTAEVSGTRLAGKDATLDVDGKLPAEGIAALTVTIDKDGKVLFENGGKFLTSGATGGALSFADTANEYSLWEIEDAGDGLFFLKNANAVYNGGAQYLEFYNTFTTYGKKDTAAPGPYAMSFRAIAEASVEPTPEPTTEPTPEPSPEPTSEITTLDLLTSAPADGSTVVIYHPNSKMALTATASGKKLAGAEAAVAGGKLPVSDAIAQLIVSENDGVYTFAMADGKVLTSAETGNGLSFADPGENDLAKWKLEQQADGTWYLMNVGANYQGNYNQALEYYSGFTTYGVKADNDAYKFEFYGIAPNADPVSGLKTGDKVAIYNDANGKAMTAAASGTRLAATDASLDSTGKIAGENIAILTVTVNDDGKVLFENGGKYLTSGETGNSLSFADAANDYSLWEIEDAGDGLFFLKNANAAYNGSAQYLEYYNTFTTYGKKATAAADPYAMSFRKVAESAPGDDVLNAGDQIVIYCAAAEGSLGLDSSGLNASLGNIPTDIRDGMAYPNNGAYVFTVGVENGCYTFSAGGKYLATCNTEQLFMADELADTGDNCGYWTLQKRGDGYLINSKTARYNSTGVVCIEFFSGAFSGWTFKAADQDIFIFNFYPVHSTISTLDDVTNVPAVQFYAAESPVKQAPYTVTFGLDDLTPLEQLTVEVTLNGEPVTNLENDGKNFSFIVPEEVTAVENSLNVNVQVTNAAGGIYFGAISMPVLDIPYFVSFSPEPGSKTGDNLMPLISAEVKNISDRDSAVFTIAGVSHPAQIQNGVVSWQPTEPLKEGRVSVLLQITRQDGVEGEQMWSFTVGEGGERLYFGQLHSHTTYSDGSGTLETALQYIKNLPESANVQFVAFTDHSNYFDATTAANPEGALYDMSLASESSRNLWSSYKQTVAQFNDSQTEIVAIAGFEMTWSGGPGHINTFNSPGIVSRNNSTLNNKTNDAGMKAYYALLDQGEGALTLSQFNHPGKTFGNFSDFSYWDAVTDSRFYMVEVGNGEGQIGAGGYYPSYEQYIMALDKGWHLAPTNNQDNHKGRWGNANDARDVILTDDFSEQGIYDAISAMRMYATEDKNLEIYYTVNDLPLGSTIAEVPEALDVNVQVSDPDASDKISSVEVVVNSGKTIHSFSASEISTGSMSVSLAPDYSYYFIRVVEADGDIAVTAPVWVGETLKLGISALDCSTAMPVTGEELTLTTTVFNSEASPATVKSITYTTSGNVVIGSDTTERTVPAGSTLDVPFNYTPDKAKYMEIVVTVVMEQDGKEYTFVKNIDLDVQDAEKLVYIGIDASHYNEYVSGNYKDSMGNFGALASGYGVRTVELKTSEELIAACSNEKFAGLIFTAPSRRLAAAQADPKTYSAEELAAIKAFNEAGGLVVVSGWGDAYENYDVITGNPNVKHMAATQNELLAALGSSIRLGDDEVVDDELNGGQAQRLYLDAYNADHYLMEGVVVDPEHPNDRNYSEVYSNYGGCSVFFEGETVPATVTPVVYGHTTTYAKDCDGDGWNGMVYPYGDSSRVVVMASEQLDGKGEIIVSGAAFMSNFEVQAEASSGSSDADMQKNYSNYKICENLVKGFNEVAASDIAEVRAQTEDGYKFTIEGIVTSNASGYDKDTAFFDCIYVQDETGGICCFPVSGDYKIGDQVRITGYTDFYQGEPELQVTAIKRLSENNEVQPTEVPASAINDRSAEGMLVTVKGTVESFELENGLIQTIMVKDEKGDVARVFIDGYITTAKDVENCVVGAQISATGLASYDDTFNAPDGPFPRIRVRDRADVVCVPQPILTGWQQIDNEWYYFNDEGEMQTGWQKINHVWYYFNDEGVMLTGWQKIDNVWYYFVPTGHMVTGWQKIDNVWYYFAPGGQMQTGWQQIKGTWYYLKPSGAMAAREWINGWWLNADGSWTYEYRGSWQKNDKGWWYGDTSGWYACGVTQRIDDKLYTFDSRGYWDPTATPAAAEGAHLAGVAAWAVK